MLTNSREMEKIMEEGPGIRKVRLEYSFEWLKAAWRIARAHYGLILGASLVSCGGAFLALALRGYVGILIFNPFMSLLTVGMVTISRDLVSTGKSEFMRLFLAFSDIAILRKVLPYVLLNLGISLVAHAVQVGSRSTGAVIWTSGTTLALVLSWGVLVITSFSVPQILFLDRPFVATLAFNLGAIRKNLLPLVAFILLLASLFVVCAAALVLPLFFVYMPIVFSLQYLIYASLFEGLRPQAVLPAADHAASAAPSA